jgi:outer membrane cobalamin receptor
MKSSELFVPPMDGRSMVMRRWIGIIVLGALLIAVSLYSQPFGSRDFGGGIIRGRVVDSELQIPIEYVNIVLFVKANNKQLTGTITDKDGYFALKGIGPGTYRMSVMFMGYHSKQIDPVELKPGQMEIDLGTISLKQALIALEGVEVVEEKPAIEFKIDKKVINVSKQYTAISGTAVDVLENVPSVSVDIEGNVSLRGSENFTVLIDGKPTVLEPNEVLQQIPAGTIEDIEIITNPSAKYDPEGISGIINIITKKKKLSGISGIMNANGGLNDKYGGDLLLNVRREKYNISFGGDYNRRFHPGEYRMENRTFQQDTTSFVTSSGESDFRRRMYGGKLGIDLYLGSRDALSTGFRYGDREMERVSVTDFDEWTEPGDSHDLYISNGGWERGGYFYSGSIDYRHTFSKQHDLSGQLILSRRTGDEESFDELMTMTDSITNGQRSKEEGPGSHIRAKLDYVVPIRENDKFETGLQSRFRWSEDIFHLFEYDSLSQQYEYRPEFSHETSYDRTIHSLYSIYAGELGPFGYQGGVRGEYTYRFIELVGEDQEFGIDRWDVFPTVHGSYEFSKGNQVMASYTRRIDRPRGWFLEPFLTWSDAYNVRQGNPDLRPEYIDSYEMGYQKYVGRNSISAEAYYRVTHNKIERIRSVYQPNVILHTIDNVGTDYALGTEAMLNLELFKLWSLSLMGNIYDYRVEGESGGQDFSQESFNWSARFNNTWKLGNSTRLQFSGMYRSPSVSSQGKRDGFFFSSAAIKQNIFSKNLTATLSIRDLFGTGKHDYTSEGVDFYSRSEFSRESQVFMLTLTYNFNNYKPEKDRETEGEIEGFEEEGEL